MAKQRKPEPPSEGAAAGGSSAEPPLNVVLSLALEPTAFEESPPKASEPLQTIAAPAAAAPADLPGFGTEAQRGVAVQPTRRGIDRLARRFSPRVVQWISVGLLLFFLVLIISAWSTSTAGVIFPDWGLASLRIGLAAATLGAVLLLFYVLIWQARVRPMPVYSGVLGLLLVLVGVSGLFSAAPLHRLQGLWLEGRGEYGLALAAYQESGDSVAQSQDIARLRVEWAEQLSAQREYGDAVAQIEPVVRFYNGDATLAARARLDLIGDYLAWGDQARQQGTFKDALAHYQVLQSAAYCDLVCQAQVHIHIAQALFGLAQQLAANKHYADAIATYQQLVQNYSDTPEADEANLALTTPQMLTGSLVYADKTPAKQFQVLLASQWNFNPSTQVFTLSGRQYRAQTDDAGRFVLPSVAVGATYMIAWIDANGHAGTCNTTNNQPLYTVQMLPLRATDVGSLNIECAS